MLVVTPQMSVGRVLRVTLAFCVCAFSLSPVALSLQGSLQQGSLLLGKVAPKSKVFYQGEALQTTEAGEFLLGLSRDAPETINLRIIDAEGVQSLRSFPVVQRQYSIQHVNGVPQRTVAPSDSDIARIRSDSAMVKHARTEVTQMVDFLQGFMQPLQGPVTGVYGSQRVYNGEPRSPHFGVDYAAPTGTAVMAPASGIVRLAHPDLFYSGGTLIIDHGHGLSSSFLHLSDILVKEGDQVESGQVIAEVGATGRATGPHLDWRMNWRQVRIDPELVLKTLPAR